MQVSGGRLIGHGLLYTQCPVENQTSEDSLLASASIDAHYGITMCSYTMCWSCCRVGCLLTGQVRCPPH